ILPHLEFIYEGRRDKHTLIDFDEYYQGSSEGLSLGMAPIETERLIFATNSTFQRKRKEYIFDKSVGKSFASAYYDEQRNLFRIGLINDLDGGIPFFPYGQVNEKWLYTLRSPNSIKR